MNLLLGVIVYVNKESDEGTRRAAHTLADALNAEGFSATNGSDDTTPLDVVSILVGKNPKSMQPIIMPK
jgi:hypothetical protein